MSLVIDLKDLMAKHKAGELRCPATALIALCSSNFQHTYTIRQHMCDMNLGAKGSVLQELWDFLNLYIECLP